MSVNTKMTAIADEIRTLSGTTGIMGLDAMASTLNTENTNFASNLSTQDSLITQIQTALAGKAGGSADPVLQEKTVTPTTSKQTITADSGYDGLDTVTVNAMPTATQATPTLSIDSAGKITATSTQTAGYVVAGTKTGTKQLTTQAAKTITPSTSSQTAVASGVYTTGAVTVAGDANLKAENIAEGVSIFGIAGTHSGSSSGGSGSGIETCTLTLNGNGPMAGGEKVYYIDGSLTAQSVLYPDLLKEKETLTVVKNSLVYTENCSASPSGNIILISGAVLNARLYFISGDASMTTW